MSLPGASAPRAKPSNWNAPNLITIARMVATPFFVWMLLADDGRNGPWRWAAAAFFVVAIATDAWDGYLARSRGLITDLGKLLDPIADKLLTGAALVALSVLGELPWWVTIVVLVREIGITVHRLMVARDVVVAAAWMGKLKTVAQSVAITLALLPLASVLGSAAPLAVWANIVTMTAAVLLTILSGIDYVLAFARAGKGRR
ncbi:CDP-diacylglycerol--glycerol-3-phosphate 3-phosphatidyltransferase [Leucobacter massiliensis]|uniref:CDP-diacylglycerol--glycerol-3-phosphate 3-phosphatidyltransferase n=1 Tax=Leucobacter massiliensis TaxID=1686285 RepID=A0A2S9QMC9_9MICO|nr:CDP-diacylglycerol--glycerol-3-phosphate 3-phosphatidyltransferase [Leucobacter massiliensis]PRI10741.1 CDP-diacylglycerol--glycerol-3-phosphate 3-phosphatidyltransferase [Leucobacter massiliensis]